MQTARSFLSGLIDYAGLFPPASLTMDEAVRMYANHAGSADKGLLGRFVIPVSRLSEFSTSAVSVLPRGEAGKWWRLSVIGENSPEADRESVLEFNCAHAKESAQGHAICDAFELRVLDRETIAEVLETLPNFIDLYLEVGIASDPEPLIAAMSGSRAAAKMRTGGVTAGAIPVARDVLRFMRACHTHGVRFKATAGLHHAIRANYPLTYAKDSLEGEMFGYLNIFIGAAFLHAGSDDEMILRILEEREASAFVFTDEGASWRGNKLSVSQLEHTRHNFALSYGSCSFAEPVEEAKQLGLI